MVGESRDGGSPAGLPGFTGPAKLARLARGYRMGRGICRNTTGEGRFAPFRAFVWRLAGGQKMILFRLFGIAHQAGQAGAEQGLTAEREPLDWLVSQAALSVAGA